jgi:hypothetical protein
MMEVVYGTAAVAPETAAEEMEQTYHEALQVMAQPLLHSAGPVALKAVRHTEQQLSKGVVSSSCEVRPPLTPQQSAVEQTDEVLHRFGRLVLRLMCDGE